MTYEVIEYLESTGTQYIDTGIVSQNNLIYDFKLIETAANNQRRFFGFKENSAWLGAGVNDANWGSSFFYVDFAGQENRITSLNYQSARNNNGVYHFDYTDGNASFTHNGNKLWTSTSIETYTGNKTVYLFSMNYASQTQSNYGIGRIYYFRITKNNNILLDLIPVRVGTVGYMYDKVTGRLFGNSGTGSFVLGPSTGKYINSTSGIKSQIRRNILTKIKKPEVLPYDSELEYIQTTGTQHFYLDVSPNVTTDAMEIYFQQTQNVTQGRPFSGGSVVFYLNGNNNFAAGLYSGTAWTWQEVYKLNVGTVKRKWKIDYLNKKVYVDDYNVYTITKNLTNQTASNLAVFWDGSTANRHIIGKLFHVKYWRNGELIRDLIPVRIGQVGYMYDKITKTLYENEGTGDFILGRDRYTKIEDYTLPDYVMSETAVLDTRFVPNGNSRITLDMWGKPISTTPMYNQTLGSRQAYKNSDFTFDLNSNDDASHIFQSRDVYGNNVTYPGSSLSLRRIKIDKNKGNTNITDSYDQNVSLYSVTRAVQSFNSRYELWLGNWNQNNTSYIAGSGTDDYFSFKVYDNDVIVRKYIPAIHPDGTTGFFDTIEKHFYPSDNSVPFRPGYVHTSAEGYKFVFYNTGISDNLGYLRNNSDLLSSLIPIKTRQIKIKRDPNYTTKVIEYGCRRILKKGDETIISSDSEGAVIEVSPDCDHIALLIEECPFDYNPDVDVIDVGIPNYLCFTALEDGTFTFTIGSTINTTQLQYIEYSTDNGETWIKTNNVGNSTITITTPTITTGNKVLWRGIGQRTANNTQNGTSQVSKFSSTGQYDASGNVLSLIYGEDFVGKNSTPTSDTCTFRCLFYQSSKLVHTHELCLPIFWLRNYCYDYMFAGCTSLISTPKLHSPKLAACCYQNMFRDCSSLNNIPYLPATFLNQHCYDQMFRNCTSLTSVGNIIPTISNLVNTYAFSSMFHGCSNLVDASELTINLLNQNYTCNYMFADCTSLLYPPTITATSVSSYGCQYMFYGCTSLVNAPSLPATTLGTYCYQYMFYNCTSLTNPPALPATTLQNYCYQHMFRGCTSLVTAPVLPATGTISNYAYNQMFRDCTALVNPPELPAIAVNTYGYYCMFYGCTSLTNAPDLSALILGTYAYTEMFKGTAIARAPELIAPIVPVNAYSYMFADCPNLNYIKCTAGDISAADCLLNWTCDWDSENDNYDTENSGVASTGIFIQRAGITWPTGVSGIPEGWTIIYLNPEDGKYYTDSACTTLWSNAPEQPYTSKIEYLQNNGTTARIKTKLNYTSIDKYEIKFRYDSWSSYAYIMGNYSAEAANTIRIILRNTDSGELLTYFNTRASNGSTVVSAAKGEDHIITAEHNVSVIIDGEEVPITNTTTNTANGNQLTLFAANSTNTTAYPAQRRIYYFKAWKNGVLVRNLIPVRVDTEGAMYDLASGELLENPMSGLFTLGNDIN